VAISFVGSYAGTHNSTSDVSVALSNLRNESNAQPTLAQNDFVLVVINNASTTNRPDGTLSPTGYTGIYSPNLYQNDSHDVNAQASYKFMGSTPDTTIGIRASNATTAGVAYTIHVLRGVDTTTPFDVTPTSAQSNNSGLPNAPSIEPVTAGAWLLISGMAAHATGTAASATPPTGMSGTTNHYRTALLTTTSNDPVIATGLKTDWSSGAYDPAAFGGFNTTNTGSWAAMSIALRPADLTAPTITSTNTASVNENQPLNKALTADESVTWSLQGGADVSHFEINSSSLRFSGNSTRDYENPTDSNGDNQYVVVVRATDPSSNFTDQTITVTLTDVVPPVFTSSTTPSVNENSTLAHVISSDTPAASLSIVGGADASKFELSGSTSGSTLRWAGDITKNYEAPDDADTNNVYDVTLRLTHAGETRDQTFSVTVLNVAAPNFTSASAISVQENTALSHALTFSSGSPTLSILGGDDNLLFNLSGSNLVWSIGTRDFEAPEDANADNIYLVTIRAAFGAEITDQNMSVTVTNSTADDDVTPPTITSSASVNVAENATLAHTLTANEAVDWVIRTSAQDGASVDYTHFELSGTTLRWTANGTKNFESPGDTGANNTYVVVVRATDGVGLTTDQTITVTVTNVFENNLNALTGSFSVNENTTAQPLSAGTVVGTPTGLTAGSTKGLSDNAGGRFTINTSTGEITVANPSLIDYEAATSHDVTVVETIGDAANSPRSTVLTIQVNNLDDVSPTITNRLNYSVLPGKPWSITLTASEAVTWTKTGGADAAQFTLTGNSLSLGAKPARQTYVVQITATDGAGNASSANVTVSTVKRRRSSVTM
jgi:hypothetical protein